VSEPVAKRLAEVRERIAAAARRTGRSPEAITLIGVAKGQPAGRVAEAIAAGLEHVGENYVQEARERLPELRRLLATRALAWPRLHFIGRLQRNKAREVAREFDVIESVDRAALGRELDRRAAELDRTLDVMIQVNTDAETTKGGVAPDGLRELLAEAGAWGRLRLTGLMAIPAPQSTPEASRAGFARLRVLAQALRREPGGDALRELSMGMSADFEIAIEEGATSVRVGTAIFGPRPRKREDPV